MSNRLPRVFVPQVHSHRDFAEAKEYGELLFCTSKHLNDSDPEQVTAIMLDLIDCLGDEDYSPTDDLILMSGDLVVLFMMASAITAYVGINSEVKVLKWANRQRKYHEITVTL